MSAPDTRIEDLEVKVAFLEHTLSQLDEVVRELADDNVALKRQVVELTERVKAASQGADIDASPHQVPPHY